MKKAIPVLCLVLMSSLSLKLFCQSFSENVKAFITVDAESYALTDAKVIDGTGSPAKDHQTIIVAHGQITDVGNASAIKIPAELKTINCTGKTIIPGMIMMHEHMFYGESVQPMYIVVEMPVSFPELYLAGGVTTMRTTGCVEPQTDLNLKHWINEGTIVGPDIDVTAPYIERAAFLIP